MRAQITDERNFDFCGDKPHFYFLLISAPENKPVEKNAKQVLTLGKLAGIEYGRKVFLNEGEGIILFLIGWDHT